MNTAVHRASISVISPILAVLLVLAAAMFADGPGFRSRRQYGEHFQKHGAEFGKVTQEQYLKLAQDFRDAPKGGDILEVVKSDGVITRYHRKKGYFGAFNPDRTIRTFFMPNDGERYFWRQAKRPSQ